MQNLLQSFKKIQNCDFSISYEAVVAWENVIAKLKSFLFLQTCIPDLGAVVGTCIILIQHHIYACSHHADILLEDLNSHSDYENNSNILYTLAIMKGLTNSGLYNLYTSSIQGKWFLLHLFPLIRELCLRQSCYSFSVFQLLDSWMSTLNTAHNRSPESGIIQDLLPEGDVTTFVWSFSLGSVEYPQSGVSSYIKGYIKSIIEICRREQKKIEGLGEMNLTVDVGRHSVDIALIMLHSVKHISWLSKLKFIILTTLIPYIDIKKVNTQLRFSITVFQNLHACTVYVSSENLDNYACKVSTKQ